MMVKTCGGGRAENLGFGIKLDVFSDFCCEI